MACTGGMFGFCAGDVSMLSELHEEGDNGDLTNKSYTEIVNGYIIYNLIRSI